MGRLVGLELHNFKSYRGTTSVGFGSSVFTSIIGPNGAGKSNMMDAISFVLGVQSAHLRSSHLKDLVYRGRRYTAGAPGDDPSRAHVVAVYERDNGDVLQLKRTITTSGTSEYRINNKAVTAVQYTATLKAENILIKARNFLVFQGDVEQIAAQSPRDLTKLLETVSGSSELQGEYEALREELDKAREVSTSVMTRKRTLNSESKQYKEQLLEQEIFERKLTEISNLVKIISLYKFFHNQKRHFLLKDQLDEKRAELRLMQQQHASEETTYKKAISKYSKDVLEAKKADQTVASLKTQVEAKTRTIIPTQANRKSILAKINTCKSKILDLQRDVAKQEAEAKAISKKLTDANKLYNDFENKIAASTTSSVSAEGLKEYEELRAKFLASEGSQLEQELNLLFNEKDSMTATIVNYDNQKTNALSRTSELDNEIESELHPQLSDITSELNDNLTNKSLLAKQRESLIKRKEKANFKELELNSELHEVLVKLDELSSQQRESNKQKKLRENVSMLKNKFKDGSIRGLVGELVRPAQQKYDYALLTILGGKFDSIIVETTAVAHKCIEILKENRLGVATFIPLDAVASDPINLNYLRSVHPTAKPAIDILEYDSPSLEKAIQYVVGDTVVVDTIDMARLLKWDSSRPLANKLVSLDGSVIHKSGLMTGGQQENRSSALLTWDKNAWNGLNNRKEDLTAALAKLNGERPKEIEINLLAAEVAAIDDRLPLLRNQISSVERKIQERESEKEFHQDLIKELDENVTAKKEEMAALEKSIKKVQSKIDILQEKIYSDFCKKHKFFNGISDYEDLHGSSLRTRAKERAQFKKAIATLSNQLEFQQERLKETISREKQMQQTLAAQTETLEVASNEVASIKDQVDALEAELEVSISEKTTLDGQLQEKLKFTKALENNILEIEGKEREITKSMSHIEEALLKVDTDRVNLLKNCKIEGTNLPLTEGLLESISLSDETDKLVENIYDIEIDYSLLSELLQDNFSHKVEAELLAKMASVVLELEQLTPNAKAVERLKEVENKLKSYDRDFTKARQKENKISDKFNDIKLQRTALLMEAFNHISGEIDFIYKELTKSSTSPLGGSAYLTLEDEDEPYSGGIKYHAMPPMKRFRDMELLSGGEKTVAALALLFAVHSFQPLPFFVLDEVDAALDNANVNKVANYIRKSASPGFQFIVISLKSSLFEKSDALVGIYREQRENSSKTVTLDLREYPEEEVPLVA